MNKKDAEEITNSVLIASALLGLRAIEQLLIEKGFFTKEEYTQKLQMLVKETSKDILQKANISGDLDDLLANLQLKKESQN